MMTSVCVKETERETFRYVDIACLVIWHNYQNFQNKKLAQEILEICFCQNMHKNFNYYEGPKMYSLTLILHSLP